MNQLFNEIFILNINQVSAWKNKYTYISQLKKNEGSNNWIFKSLCSKQALYPIYIYLT